jgi:hypothetical protein
MLEADIPRKQIFSLVGLTHKEFGQELNEDEVVVIANGKMPARIKQFQYKAPEAGKTRDASEDSISKARSFGGDRSAAARYAASIRWANHVKDGAGGGRTWKQKVAEGPANLRWGRDELGMPRMASRGQLLTAFGSDAKSWQKYFAYYHGVTVKFPPDFPTSKERNSTAEANTLGALQALDDVLRNVGPEVWKDPQTGEPRLTVEFTRRESGNAGTWTGYPAEPDKPNLIKIYVSGVDWTVYGMLTEKNGLQPRIAAGDPMTDPTAIPTTNEQRKIFTGTPTVNHAFDFPRPPAPQSGFGINNDILNEFAQRRGYGTMVHELGHQIDSIAKSGQRYATVSTAQSRGAKYPDILGTEDMSDKGMGSRTPKNGKSWYDMTSPSPYGTVNVSEKFAETFAAWFLFSTATSAALWHPSYANPAKQAKEAVETLIREKPFIKAAGAVTIVTPQDLPVDHPINVFSFAPSLVRLRGGAQAVLKALTRMRLLDRWEALKAKSFGGDRSAAGRYAAQIRWANHNALKPWNQIVEPDAGRDFRGIAMQLPVAQRKKFADAINAGVPYETAYRMATTSKRYPKGKTPPRRSQERLAGEMVASTRNTEGSTMHAIVGDVPQDGFIVAKQGTTKIVRQEQFLGDPVFAKDTIKAFMRKHARELSKPDSFLGIWHDKANGEVVLDVTFKVKDRDEAIAAGAKENQQYIWDVIAKEAIYTGGTGDRETESPEAAGEVAKASGPDDGGGVGRLRGAGVWRLPEGLGGLTPPMRKEAPTSSAVHVPSIMGEEQRRRRRRAMRRRLKRKKEI